MEPSRSSGARPVDPARWTGALLMGGASRRMGEDKLGMLLPDGRRVLDGPADALRGTCARLLGAGADGPEDPRLPSGFDPVPDPVAERPGPLVVLGALLATADTPWLLLAAGDLPLLRADHLSALAQAAEEDPQRALVALSARGPEPLVAAYPCALADAVEHVLATGRRSMHAFLEQVDWRPWKQWTEASPATIADPFFNLNQPQDWILLQQRFRPGKRP